MKSLKKRVSITPSNFCGAGQSTDGISIWSSIHSVASRRATLSVVFAISLFISGAAKFLLSDRKPDSGYQRPAAMVQQMMDLLTLSGGEIHTARAPLSLPEAEVAAAATALPEGPTYIGIAPGAGGRQKCWPLDRFIALAQHQIDAGRIPVFILGPGEAEWTPSLINAVPGALFPTVGKNGRPNPSVSYSIAVGRRLKAAVANDAGVGHILAAADTPLVSLFGPTPAAKFAPAAATLTVIEAQSFGGTR